MNKEADRILSHNIDKWVFPRALPPMVTQYISMKMGYAWSLPIAFSIYAVWSLIFARMLCLRLKVLTAEHGYLDQKSPRDHTPDAKTSLTAVHII